MKILYNILFAVFLGAWLPTMSQDTLSIQNMVLDYYKKVPKEKAFIQTDKPYYLSGDTIWYRVHLVDLMTGIPVCRSKYVYIELLGNDTDELVERQMVKCDSDGVFDNAIFLSKNIPDGIYTLVAYTQWMRNFGEENFCYKTLQIVGDTHTAIKKRSMKMPGRPVAEKNNREGQDLKAWTTERDGKILIQPPAIEGKDVVAMLVASGEIFELEQNDDKIYSIDTHKLNSNLVHLALIDRKSLSVIDEYRLEIEDRDKAEVTIKGKARKERESMTLDIDVKDASGQPLSGLFSLSVTDYDVVKPDSSEAVLIDSFRHTTYDTPLADILRGQYPKIDYGFQTRQLITGSVHGTIGNRVKHPRLIVVNTTKGLRHEFELGDSSRFMLEVDCPENTTFVLEATRKSGSTGLVQLDIDPQNFPKLKMPALCEACTEIKLPENFVSQSRRQHTFNSSGYIELPEIVKTGKKRIHKYNNWGGVEASYVFGEDDPRLGRATTMRELFGLLGIRNVGKIFVDNIPVGDDEDDQADFYYINPTDIKSIEYFSKNNPINNLFGVNPTRNGVVPSVVFVFIKDGSEVMRKGSRYRPSMAVVRQLGYRNPIKFFSPKYEETDKESFSLPDFRTTLYWNPKVEINETGHTKLEFCASDISKSYLVTLEGISNSGVVVYKQVIIL